VRSSEVGGLASNGVAPTEAAAVGRHEQRTRRVGRPFGLGLMNSRLFDLFSIISNGIDLIRSTEVLPHFKKNQIKYGFEAFEIRNNFPYWDFSSFGIEFELKNKEALGFEFQ
jgi:hypothetical protein